jgi:hypothetical protein
MQLICIRIEPFYLFEMAWVHKRHLLQHWLVLVVKETRRLIACCLDILVLTVCKVSGFLSSRCSH